MAQFHVTIERKIIRTIIVDSATRASARKEIEAYGVVEAFSDYQEAHGIGACSDRCKIIRVERTVLA